jgi:hypothetical protein
MNRAESYHVIPLLLSQFFLKTFLNLVISGVPTRNAAGSFVTHNRQGGLSLIFGRCYLHAGFLISFLAFLPLTLVGK